MREQWGANPQPIVFWRFTLWPFSPNSSISWLLYKALANFSHFRHISHLRQNRHCDFSPFSSYSPLLSGPFASSFDLQGSHLAILVNITIFVKITTFKGPVCHLIANFIKTLANVRHIRRQLQIRHFRQICNFHQNLNGNLWLCYYLFAKLGEFSLFFLLGAFLDMSGWIGPKHSKNEVVIVSNGRFLL